MEKPKREAYGVYYVITKWNYYHQFSDVIVHSNHKPLQKFLNGKNTNNKVTHWSLELVTYNITLKWISSAANKAVDCLFRLVEVLNIVNKLPASSLMQSQHHQQMDLPPAPRAKPRLWQKCHQQMPPR